jgi:hypothetical protein
MTHVDPFALTIWIVVIGISFVYMLVKVCRSVNFLRTYRQGLKARIKALRINNMLGRVGVGLPRYLRKAHPTDIERHLIACQDCKTTQICNAYLEERIKVDDKSFCPNYAQLKSYKSQSEYQSRKIYPQRVFTHNE